MSQGGCGSRSPEERSLDSHPSASPATTILCNLEIPSGLNCGAGRGPLYRLLRLRLPFEVTERKDVDDYPLRQSATCRDNGGPRKRNEHHDPDQDGPD